MNIYMQAHRAVMNLGSAPEDLQIFQQGPSQLFVCFAGIANQNRCFPGLDRTSDLSASASGSGQKDVEFINLNIESHISSDRDMLKSCSQAV